MAKRMNGRGFLVRAASMTSCLALAHAALAQNAGRVTTTGPGERGIEARGGEEQVAVKFSVIETSGDRADGVVVDSLGPVTVTGSRVATSGNNATGIDLTTRDGPVQVQVDSVSATGNGSDAIRVAGGTGATSNRTANVRAESGTALDIATTGAITVGAGSVVTGATGDPGVRLTGGAGAIDAKFVTVAT